MPYTPIAIDREALTIMGVPFPNLEVLESTAEAIGSNMFVSDEDGEFLRRGLDSYVLPPEQK